MPKTQITLNDETMDALKQASRKERRPVATIIREGIELRLKQAGVEVDTYVAPGGDRRSENKAENE